VLSHINKFVVEICSPSVAPNRIIMPLTDAIIKATKSNPSCRIALTDGQGLQLRISTKNKRSWSLQYRFHGSMKKLTLGSWPNITCSKARKLANEARYAIARGIDPQAIKREAKVQKQKLREVWELYDQMHIAKNIKEKTAKGYRRNAANDILPKLGKLNINEIEKAIVVRLIDSIAKRAPVMANRTLGLLRHFFDWAVGRGHLDTNPTLGIPKAIKEAPRKRVLSLTEMRSIYLAAEGLTPANMLFLQLLLLTGQRAGVIARLTASERNDGYLEISGDRNKSGERILVPLPQIAQIKLDTIKHTDGPFLISTTNGLKPISGFSKLKKQVDVLSGVSDWRFHDIRRGIATHLEDYGVDRFYVERILTHKDKSVTGIYAKSNHLEKRLSILQQWSKALTAKDGMEAENIVNFKGTTA